MTFKVLLSSSSSMLGFELIQAHLDPGIDVEFARRVPEDATYQLLVSAAPTRDHLLASPNLRQLIVPFTGPSPNLIRLVSDFPHVTLHQLPYDSTAVAETALALLLSTAKFILIADAELRHGDWSHRYRANSQFLLSGRTALVLGYGRVGSYLANVLTALNMNVMAIRRHLDERDLDNGKGFDPNAKIYGPDALSRLLPKADVLICTLPDTPETNKWIGAKELGLMPKHALVVNVGQGEVFDEAALFAALRRKHIAGAGLDVWYDYPADKKERTHTNPSRFPFASLDNVVMSPHRAGQLGEEDGGRVALLASIINKAYRGEPLPYKVNLALGY